MTVDWDIVDIVIAYPSLRIGVSKKALDRVQLLADGGWRNFGPAIVAVCETLYQHSERARPFEPVEIARHNGKGVPEVEQLRMTDFTDAEVAQQAYEPFDDPSCRVSSLGRRIAGCFPSINQLVHFHVVA